MFGDDAFTLVELIVGRRGAHIDGLMGHCLKLLETQGAVIQCGLETETIVYKIGLAGLVSTIHGTDLRHSDVALVDDGEEVVREVVQQAERSHAGPSPIEVTRVVLDARAISHLAHHLHVIGHTLVQALGLGEAVLAGERSHLVLAVKVNLPHGGLHAFLGGHKDVGRENLESLHVLGGHLRLAVEHLDALDLVAPKDDAQHDVLIAQEHVNRVTLDTEGTHLQFCVAAGVQGVHQAVQQLVAPYLITHLELDGVGGDVLGVTHTIQA